MKTSIVFGLLAAMGLFVVASAAPAPFYDNTLTTRLYKQIPEFPASPSNAPQTLAAMPTFDAQVAAYGRAVDAGSASATAALAHNSTFPVYSGAAAQLNAMDSGLISVTQQVVQISQQSLAVATTFGSKHDEIAARTPTLEKSVGGSHCDMFKRNQTAERQAVSSHMAIAQQEIAEQDALYVKLKKIAEAQLQREHNARRCFRRPTRHRSRCWRRRWRRSKTPRSWQSRPPAGMPAASRAR